MTYEGTLTNVHTVDSYTEGPEIRGWQRAIIFKHFR
jgi:hypothetical protein